MSHHPSGYFILFFSFSFSLTLLPCGRNWFVRSQFQSLALQSPDHNVQPLTNYSTGEEVRLKRRCNACQCTSVFCIAQFSQEPLGFSVGMWKVSLLFLSLFSLLSRTEGLGGEPFLRVALPCYLPAELEICCVSRT